MLPLFVWKERYKNKERQSDCDRRHPQVKKYKASSPILWYVGVENQSAVMRFDSCYHLTAKTTYRFTSGGEKKQKQNKKTAWTNAVAHRLSSEKPVSRRQTEEADAVKSVGGAQTERLVESATFMRLGEHCQKCICLSCWGLTPWDLSMHF